MPGPVRDVAEPERLNVVEGEAAEVERADREQRKVVLGVAGQLAVAAELLVQVAAQVRAARRVLHPERQVFPERRARADDQVVALEEPDTVLDAAAGAPEGQIAAEVRARDIDAAAQRGAGHDRELAGAEVERHRRLADADLRAPRGRHRRLVHHHRIDGAFVSELFQAPRDLRPHPPPPGDADGRLDAVRCQQRDPERTARPLRRCPDLPAQYSGMFWRWMFPCSCQ